MQITSSRLWKPVVVLPVSNPSSRWAIQPSLPSPASQVAAGSLAWTKSCSISSPSCLHSHWFSVCTVFVVNIVRKGVTFSKLFTLGCLDWSLSHGHGQWRGKGLKVTAMCAAGAGPAAAQAGLAGEKKEKSDDTSSLHPWSKPSKILSLWLKLKVSNELLLHTFWELFKGHPLWWGLGRGSLQGAFYIWFLTLLQYGGLLVRAALTFNSQCFGVRFSGAGFTIWVPMCGWPLSLLGRLGFEFLLIGDWASHCFFFCCWNLKLSVVIVNSRLWSANLSWRIRTYLGALPLVSIATFQCLLA